MKYLIILAMLALNGCTFKKCIDVEKMVMKVGGCSEGGNCGVMYNDGTTGVANRPVEGQIVEARVCK